MVTVLAAVETAMENAACNAWADSIDGGLAAGSYHLYLADTTTEVAECVGQYPFFGASAAGVAAQSGTAVGTLVTGSASPVTHFKARTSAGVECWNGTVAESAADLNIDDQTIGGGVIINPGATVTLSSIQLTVTLTP